MAEYMLQCAESMRDSILHCKRDGATYDYCLIRMMHYAQSAIDRKLNRKRTLNREGWK